jgi:hypothetical protein
MLRLACAFSFVLGLAVSSPVLAADAAESDADFTVQGEYAGELALGDKKANAGAQVVALGDHKFDVVLYFGGLPGAGWKRGDKSEKATGETKEGTTTFKGKDWTATIAGGVMQIAMGPVKLGELKKTERKSPSLGAKPPEGAVVLFDGKSVDKFKNGRMTEDGLLMVGTETKDKFGSHTLHIEFRTPFMPKARGQGRGNSGVYIQGRHECQVLDSFGLEGENNECGGIYTVAKPIVNACLPPGAWQTYDIEYTAAKYDNSGKKTENARTTIKHNGILIHDNIDLKDGTPGKNPEGPGPDVLYLQNHNDPVHFRNIWIVEKK